MALLEDQMALLGRVIFCMGIGALVRKGWIRMPLNRKSRNLELSEEMK